MDIILSSSRGNYIRKELKKRHPNPGNLIIITKKGGQLDELAAMLKEFFKRVPQRERSQCHVYFLAGLCDLTYRDVDPEYKFNMNQNCYEPYEEVIFMETPAEANLRLFEIAQRVSDGVIKQGARPCFATVVPCSLSVWNNIRLNQQVTSFLLHNKYYEDMQHALIEATLEVNRDLVAINTRNQMCTPYIGSTVIVNEENQKHRVYYKKLSDGVHPTRKTAKIWAKKMVKTMSKNRARSFIPMHITQHEESESDTD